MNWQLQLTLLSDATFGRGEGLAGLVDTEVEHDEDGLPYLRGRTLKGLVVEECANLLYGGRLGAVPDKIGDRLEQAAAFLFGRGGSSEADTGRIRVGAAQLPEALRQAVRAEVEAFRAGKGGLSPSEVLESLTDIRRQTAISDQGTPETGSLRSMRVVLRDTVFSAELTFLETLDASQQRHADALALLGAAAACLRRAGTGRNRGRGRLQTRLLQDGRDVTLDQLKQFRRIIGGARS